MILEVPLRGVSFRRDILQGAGLGQEPGIAGWSVAIATRELCDCAKLPNTNEKLSMQLKGVRWQSQSPRCFW